MSVRCVSIAPDTCLTKKKSAVHSQIGPVIVDLIEELEIQLDQEFYAYYKVDSPKLRQALPTSAPLKPLKTSVLIDKQESTVKSAPTNTVSTVKAKSPSVHNHPERGGYNQKGAGRSPRKSHTLALSTGSKTESTPIKQALVSKIMAFQKQSSKLVSKSQKPLRQNDDKIMKTVVRDAIRKYKKNGSLSVSPPETLTLPSLLSTTNKVSGQTATGKSKNRNLPKKYPRQKKNKVLSDITDMYAVGLRLTK